MLTLGSHSQSLDRNLEAMMQSLKSDHDESRAEDDIAAVTRAVQAWVSAFNEHSAPKVSALYDARAVLWGTLSAEIMSSAESVRAYFDRTFHFNPPPTVSLGQCLVRMFGDTAVASGAYTLEFRIAGQSHLMPARFSLTYRRVPGDSGIPSEARWLIVDHHSSLVPAALPTSMEAPDAPRT